MKLWSFVFVVLVTLLRPDTAVQPKAASPAGAETTKFLLVHSDDVFDLVTMHFNLSVSYLVTGYAFGSQAVQRPGMAKYLEQQSDFHWEAGMDLLKKLMQRGADPKTYDRAEINGKHYLELGSGVSTVVQYSRMLESLLEDSKRCSTSFNNLHRMTLHRGLDNIYHLHDGDLSHFFEEKLEKEAERTREFAGHLTTLSKMADSGMALHFFDSHL